MSMDFVLQLERLDIKSCKMVEQVILLDEENKIDTNQCRAIKFSKLPNLSLHSLESLATFSKGFESIEFPMLVDMSIKGCPKLTIFFSSIRNNRDSTGHDNDTFHLFCSETAHFPMLEKLELRFLDKLEVIWNAPISEGSNSFNNLRELKLFGLPVMTHLWKNQSRNGSLGNLKKIYVRECHKLRNLFSLVTPIDFVRQVERLDIESCKMMEQVMLLNEGSDTDTNQCRTIQFSKLSSLTLLALESLTTFRKGIERIEFSVLVDMSITNCPKLTSFISSTGNNQDSAGHDSDAFHLFCSETADFPLLERLKLNQLDKLEVIWNAPIPKGSNSFYNLRELELSDLPAMTQLWKSQSRNISLSNSLKIDVCGCHKLRNLFSSTMPMDFVLQLEQLRIVSCRMIEQVMLLDEENENDMNQCRTIRFPKLSKVTLWSLEGLTTFSKGTENIEFPMLVDMSIIGCPKLTSFLSSTKNNQDSVEDQDIDTFHLFSTEKAHFPLLRKLELNDLDKLEVIWNAPIPEGSNSFNNLRELKLSQLPAMTQLWESQSRNISLSNLSKIDVEECHNLRSLFSSTMSIDFVLQLKQLRIAYCRMIEQVMLLDEENEPNTNECRTTQFPKLSNVTLYSLEGLTTFSKGTENIEFPMLVDMSIKKCPKLTSFLSSTENNQDSLEDHNIDTFHLFCGGKTHFPMLEKLQLWCLDKLEVIWNASIPEGSNSFNNLRELELFRLPAMIHLWSSSSQNISLSNLKKIDVVKCHKLRSLFSPTMSMDFVLQLEELQIYDCNMLEQVISLDEENEKDTNKCRTIRFPKLSKLNLGSLESLIVISMGIESIEFPMLVDMRISDCPKLTSFVSPTGNNQDSAQGHDNDTSHWFCSEKTHFPMLEKLQLWCLDKLEVIWNASIPEGSNSFNNLRELELFWLPAMIHLWSSSSRNISLSNLKKIDVVKCHKLRSLFSPTMSMDFVLQLEELRIYDCKMLAQVISLDEENEKDTNKCRTIRFPKLSKLNLGSLESLIVISMGIESIEFPKLVDMRISDCPKLTSFVSPTGNNHDSAQGHDNDTSHLFCSEKVTFPSLKIIFITRDHRSNIWCCQIPLGFFSQLEKLKLVGCNNIRSLFPSLTTENLVSLRELQIHRCNEMVKVIEDNEEMLCGKPLILFPNLKKLELCELPKLGRFCNWRCDLQLPSLEQVRIRECPLLELFSMGPVSTPTLKSINFVANTNEFSGDLSAEIQAKHQEQGSTSTETSAEEADQQESEIQEE